MQDFIHLNVHSHYSIKSSLITIPEVIDKAISDGMKGMALTDDGNMFGIKEFVDYCKEVNRVRTRGGLDPFKPIIGCDMYVAPRSMHDKKKGNEKCSRLIVLARNLTGYKNLIKLVSNSWTEGLMNGMPRTDHTELEKYRGGLILISACMDGEISSKILAGDIDGARNALLYYKDIWGDDFYIECQRHEITNPTLRANRDIFNQQQIVNKILIDLGHEYGVNILCSNNCRFTDEENAETLDILWCLKNEKPLDETKCSVYSKQEWFKTKAEMNEVFRDLPEALANTLDIFSKIEFYNIENSTILPNFSIPEEFGTEQEWRNRYTPEELIREFTSDENSNPTLSDYEGLKLINKLGGVENLYRIKLEADYLSKLAYEGAKRLYGNSLSKEIEDRLRFELHIIKRIGYPRYFLLIQEIINAARNELDVWVGPGRGSAPGSIVNYCLGITKIDPLKHGLLFERFFNPDRIALPDIDIDFDADGREKVMQWIKQKYGEDNFAHIVTFGKCNANNAIKYVARVFNVPLFYANALCRAFPNTYYPARTATLKNLIKDKYYLENSENQELTEALRNSDSIGHSLIKHASQIEGLVQGTGKHACGVVISPDAVCNHVPLVMDDHSIYDSKDKATQYDGHYIESTGLVKFDFLGLYTLTEIKECVCLIKQNKGIEIDIDRISLDDEKTLQLYQEGCTEGTFLLASTGMQKYLQELHPTDFEDLVAMNALYRPGPMDYIPTYIARRNGREEVTYDVPVLEKYLKETYGIIIYQEQIMHIAQGIAGFTRGESDAFRKVITDNRHAGLLKYMETKFIEGGMQNGYSSQDLIKILDIIKRQRYAFNKSHAVAYTWLAFQTAYLKVNYPEEFKTAIVSHLNE